jgi:hypothetical protein
MRDTDPTNHFMVAMGSGGGRTTTSAAAASVWINNINSDIALLLPLPTLNCLSFGGSSNTSCCCLFGFGFGN